MRTVHAQTSSKVLYESFVRWARAAGEPCLSIKAFSQNLQERGFQRRAIGHSRTKGFEGISLRSTEEARTDADP
jgi:hypothetical protein